MELNKARLRKNSVARTPDLDDDEGNDVKNAPKNSSLIAPCGQQVKNFECLIAVSETKATQDGWRRSGLLGLLLLFINEMKASLSVYKKYVM